MSIKTPSEIIAIGDELLARLKACDLCPHECGVDRTAGETGQCGIGDTVIVASCNLHHGRNRRFREPAVGDDFLFRLFAGLPVLPELPISQHWSAPR